MSTDQGLPPYVTFVKKPEEDREATIAAGRPQYKDIDYAIITPMGSKDRIERVAAEWLADKQQQVENGRFPAKWLEEFQAKYTSWQKGEELPEEGTSIKSWSYLNPSQVQNLLGWKVYTIEQLAKANQETIGRLGMGGVSMVQAAQDFLAQANDSGKVLAELAKLRSERDAYQQQMKDLQEKVNTLKAQQAVQATT
mgnify:CR=1 FL=1